MTMVLKTVLANVMDAQKATLDTLNTGLKRDTLDSLPDITSHALIVSGIRRCGKSTLLYQLLKERYPTALYLNFEDTRLYDFEPTDFTRLDAVIKDSDTNVLFFH